MGKSTKLDDGASLGTIATQGFCNIDYARELTANLENIQDAIDLNNMLLSSIWDKYKPGERVNSEDFAALIETVKLLRSLLDSKTSTIKAAAQVQVQIVDHEHITSFMQRWFDVIKKADSKVALKIAHETRKLGNDFGYSLH